MILTYLKLTYRGLAHSINTFTIYMFYTVGAFLQILLHVELRPRESLDV